MASIFHALPQLRAAAPRLTRRLFTCQAAARPSPRSALRNRPWPRQSPVLRSLRWQSTQPLPSSSIAPAIANGARTASSAWPQTSSKSVAYWLLGSAASVFGIVIFGGLTRLTESGYSSPRPIDKHNA